jgi:hypothetical protein
MARVATGFFMRRLDVDDEQGDDADDAGDEGDVGHGWFAPCWVMRDS